MLTISFEIANISESGRGGYYAVLLSGNDLLLFKHFFDSILLEFGIAKKASNNMFVYFKNIILPQNQTLKIFV